MLIFIWQSSSTQTFGIFQRKLRSVKLRTALLSETSEIIKRNIWKIETTRDIYKNISLTRRLCKGVTGTFSYCEHFINNLLIQWILYTQDEWKILRSSSSTQYIISDFENAYNDNIIWRRMEELGWIWWR